VTEEDLQQLANPNDIVKMQAIQKIGKGQNFPLNLISTFSNWIMERQAVHNVLELFRLDLSNSLSSRALEKQAVSKMVELLHSGYESDDIRLSILDALFELGKSTEVPIPPLLAVLEDQSPRIRLKTVECLGKMRDKRAVPELLTLLEKEENKYPVIWALGEIRDKRAVPVLNRLLDSHDKYVRYNAKKALQKIG
jgi:HEAT repeat protein